MNENRQISRFVSLSVSSSRGFTLIEVLIVMAMFIGIIIISSQAFNKILSVSTQQTLSSESDTQGVIGLDVLRLDIEHAGYGLPWLLNFVADFDEGQASVGHLAPGIDTENFNDIHNASADTNKVPRAVQAAASPTDGRDYLVIKSILAGMSPTTKKWAFVDGIGGSSTLKPWGANDFVADEQVVTLDSRTKRLVGTSTTPANFSYSITAANMTPPDTGTANFQPQQDTDAFVVYGVSSSNLRVPYNRVDYYVKRPTTPGAMPTRCAPGSGILYKAVMNHSTGALNPEYPLVECVADMQVVFNVAADGVNGVDVDQSGLTGLSAKEIRQQLKMIKVYIVAHEGGRDAGFNYDTQNLVVGEGSGRTLDLQALVGSDEYKHYRWKTYKLVVIPKNINY